MRIWFFIVAILFIQPSLADNLYNWQMGLPKPASPVMEELNNLHQFLLVIIGAIVVGVISLLAYVCYRFNAKSNPTPAKFKDNIVIEIVWTIIPLLILIIIAIPSFRVIKFMDKTPMPELTIKVIGYQWYWHYIYPDQGGVEFDSYMLPDQDLKDKNDRLLAVDNNLVLPENTVIKFLITAGDVIHSFAVPALGIKMDAVPGRVNETWTKINYTGLFYGQCSELCGINHGFMPIAIQVVSKEEFNEWINTAKQKFSYKIFNKQQLAKLVQTLRCPL